MEKLREVDWNLRVEGSCTNDMAGVVLTGQPPYLMVVNVFRKLCNDYSWCLALCTANKYTSGIRRTL